MYMKFAMKNICFSMYWYISMIKCIKVLQVGVIICNYRSNSCKFVIAVFVIYTAFYFCKF